MGSKVINLVILIFGTIGMLVFYSATFMFMKFTYEGFQQQFVKDYFSVAKISKQEAQMNLFFRFGLYFAIYTLMLKLVGWIFAAF